MLDGAKILREGWNFDETINTYRDILVPLYDNEDSVCGIIYNGTPYYFLKNQQGDVIAITDNAGETLARYSYDAWGKVLSVRDTDDAEITSESHIANINPFRYRSYYFDQETQLYYLQSRYYDAEVGRFINGDMVEVAVIQQNAIEHNLYAYCGNDCVNDSDSNGTISWKKILSIFDKIGKAAKNLLNYLIEGAEWILGIKKALRPKDISKIAKKVNRSPHRVRQCFSWLEKRVDKLESKVGKIFKALSYILFFASIASVLKKVKAFVEEISIKLFNKIAEGLSTLISWGVSKGIKFFSKFVPALGGVVGFLLGELIGRFIDKLFEVHSTRIAKKFASNVDIYKFKLGDYFITFFKCLV